jgi:hypothetical protein
MKSILAIVVEIRQDIPAVTQVILELVYDMKFQVHLIHLR